MDALLSDSVFLHWSMVDCCACAIAHGPCMCTFRAEVGSRSREHSELCTLRVEVYHSQLVSVLMFKL